MINSLQREENRGKGASGKSVKGQVSNIGKKRGWERTRNQSQRRSGQREDSKCVLGRKSTGLSLGEKKKGDRPKDFWIGKEKRSKTCAEDLAER